MKKRIVYPKYSRKDKKWRLYEVLKSGDKPFVDIDFNSKKDAVKFMDSREDVLSKKVYDMTQRLNKYSRTK